ncbi:MAG: tetratricopeptide repeat protein [Acidobacteria bacterium]|nr:tetratricopeptide repeat protein [Acidobacteriota bacterium]
MFGEDALWYYKRGTARAWNGKPRDAEPDLRKALSVPGRKWVYARTHLELGRIAVNAGNKAAARPELQQAIALSDTDNDPGTAEEARRLMK